MISEQSFVARFMVTTLIVVGKDLNGGINGLLFSISLKRSRFPTR